MPSNLYINKKFSNIPSLQKKKKKDPSPHKSKHNLRPKEKEEKRAHTPTYTHQLTNLDLHHKNIRRLKYNHLLLSQYQFLTTKQQQQQQQTHVFHKTTIETRNQLKQTRRYLSLLYSSFPSKSSGWKNFCMESLCMLLWKTSSLISIISSTLLDLYPQHSHFTWLFHYRIAAVVPSSSAIPATLIAQILEAEARLVAGVDDIVQELVHILLALASKVLFEESEAALDLRRRMVHEIHMQDSRNLLLKYTKRTRTWRRNHGIT